MSDDTKGEIVSDKEALATGHDLPGLWLKKIKRAKEDEKKWREDAKEAVAIYEVDEGKDGSGVPAFNILHSNIEITVPSLYNSTPIPDVRRRFGDADQVAKVAVDVIERALGYCLDEYDFDGQIIESTRDAELAGRGVPRIRYTPTMEQQTDPMTGETFEAVGKQEVKIEHVVWDKWGHGPARHWGEVGWIYFEHDMTHAELRKMGISAERIKKLAWDSGDDDREKPETSRTSTGIMKTVKAYEVWDKESKQVLFLAENDEKQFLKVADDPLKLEQFFPIPKAMQPLRKRSSLCPMTPYKVYQTQVSELDKITKRINGLIGQLKVRGLYDKRLGADFERLRYCDDGQYEPADDATVFAQGSGGLEKAIAHWPMAEIVTALQQLYIQRDQIKQTIYEVTGLSDVLRGATDPNETLGAQQLKAQQGTTRLSMRQRMVSECCRQILRMKCEIICNHFTTENLMAMTGIQITPEVEQVLRSDLLRSYKIDVETDSTIRADVARSQEQMTLFLQGTAQYASAMAPILQMNQGAAGPVVEIYSAFARHFKLGKAAEDALDQMVEASKQPQEPKPSPEEIKAQAEQQKAQREEQAAASKDQREREKMQFERQMERERFESEQNAMAMKLQHEREMAAIKEQLAILEIKKAERLAEIEMKHKEQSNVVDLQSRREKAFADSEARHEKAEFDREQRESKAKEASE